MGLQLQRSQTFKLSVNPLFVDKVQDIVGLYLSLPDRAIVLCVDEKSQIQALDREQPVLPIKPITVSSPLDRASIICWNSPGENPAEAIVWKLYVPFIQLVTMRNKPTCCDSRLQISKILASNKYNEFLFGKY